MLDSQLPKIKALAVVCLFLTAILFSFSCFSGEVDLDMLGFTYHLHRRGAVGGAPLKLDHAGVKVFNPGLGLGYDFREDRRTGGISAVVHGGMFENCDNHPFSFVGAGGRYRKYFSKNNFFEANLLGILTYGNDSSDKSYSLAPMPYVNIGIGHDYGKYSVTYYLSYVPQNTGSNITSSTDMLFLSVGVSF
jgi:hypothetical protein